MTEFRKQIALYVPHTEWMTIRQEAARQRVSMTELCRRWMKPRLDELRRNPHRPPINDD